MPRKLVPALLLVLLCWNAAMAQEAVIWPKGTERRAKWRGNGAVAFGANELIFGGIARAFYAVPITKGKSFLTRDSNVRFGASTLVSPLVVKGGPFVGISPALVLDLDLYYNAYCEPFHAKYDSLDDDYSYWAVADKKKTVGFGQEFVASSTLKLAYAGVILVEMFDLHYFLFGHTWYSIEVVAIVDDGFHYTSKTLLLYEFKPGWRAGFMYDALYVFNSGYERDTLSVAFMGDRKLPWDWTMILSAGYHLNNSNYEGFKVWNAFLKEWDF